MHFSFIDDVFKQNLKRFRKADIKLIGIDCGIDLSVLVDIVWIPSFFIKSEIKSHLPLNVIYGWDSYFNYKNRTQEKWKHGKNVLVLTGGSDVTKQGQVLPLLFEEKINHPIIINWVQGPYSDAPLIPNNSKHLWRIHKAPSGISHLIEETNYAVSLYGVSLFELLSHGIPTAVFSSYMGRDDNELNELSSQNICLVSKDASDAVLKLAEIMMTPKRAIELSEKSSSILRNSGLENIVKMISSMKNSKNE